MKRIISSFSLLLLALFLSSWGSRGHKRISQNMASSLPASMFFLNPAWTNFVTNHASDADYRKDQDPNESPRHYIDIDNYPEFIAIGSIHPSYDSAVYKHGLPFVIDQGTLPWTTLRTFDSLRSCFQRGDWDRSALYAADLGHYVGDGHMPLHITRNYDGQYTGQNGVHSRYETTLIKKYENQLVYPADSAVVIADPASYIFDYLYANYKYIDSILLADTYARQKAGDITSENYYAFFWEKSRYFTIKLMQHGSNALASLIYTAWVQSGSPHMYPNGISEPEIDGQPYLLQSYPNPADAVVIFPVIVTNHPAAFTLQIYDLAGTLKDTIVRNSEAEGINRITWETGAMAPGVYVCMLKSGTFQSTCKFVVRH